MTLEETVTLYALGALKQEEAEDLRRELAEAPHLQALLARERAMTALILASVEPNPPSSALKLRVLEQVGASVGAPVGAHTGASPDASTTTAALATSPKLIVRKPRPEATSPSFARLSAERPSRSVLPWVFAVFSTVAALAAIALTILFATRWQQAQQDIAQLQSQAAQLQTDGGAVRQALDEATARATQLDRDLAQTKADLAETQRSLIESRTDAQRLSADVRTLRADVSDKESALAQMRTEMAVLLQPGVRVAALTGLAEPFRGVTVTVYYTPRSTTAYVSVVNLPALTSDQTYQLWLIRGNQRQPSSVFNTDATGAGRLIVNSSEPFSAYQTIGITVEPAGGSTTPNPAGPIIQGRL